MHLETFSDILTNRVIVFPIVAYLTAQLLKLVFRLLGYPFRREHRFLFESGGMPSAHAAIVTVLVIVIARSEGFHSVLFGLSVIFAAIVIYDAIYVRGRADKQAIVLNRIADKLKIFKKDRKHLVIQEGHTKLEVLGGIVWGVIVAVVLIWIF